MYPASKFDDLAAESNPDCRIVAEDLSLALRQKPALRKLIRAINEQELTTEEIELLTVNIGGTCYDTK